MEVIRVLLNQLLLVIARRRGGRRAICW